MRTKLSIMLSLLIAACGVHHAEGPVIGGYQVLAMNPEEVYVANADRELIVGPTISEIAVVGMQIIVYCGQDARSVNGFANTVGYNIIDTRTGVVTKDLTEAQLRAVLNDENLEMPTFTSPSKYFK